MALLPLSTVKIDQPRRPQWWYRPEYHPKIQRMVHQYNHYCWGDATLEPKVVGILQSSSRNDNDNNDDDDDSNHIDTKKSNDTLEQQKQEQTDDELSTFLWKSEAEQQNRRNSMSNLNYLSGQPTTSSSDLPIPLFTSILILLMSLYVTGYGFYVGLYGFPPEGDTSLASTLPRIF